MCETKRARSHQRPQSKSRSGHIGTLYINSIYLNCTFKKPERFFDSFNYLVVGRDFKLKRSDLLNIHLCVSQTKYMTIE